MRKAMLATLALIGAAHHTSAFAGSAAKCTAEYTEGNWPYNATLLYTPENTSFRFVCPGLTPQTIPQLYQLGWNLVGLPWKEPNFGGSNRWAIWIEKP